jgi:hypothetical protein
MRNKFPKFTWKDIDMLLEKAEPLLDEGELSKARQLLGLSRLHSMDPLRDFVGCYLFALVEDHRDSKPYKRDELPEILMGSHVFVAGLTGTGKTRLADYQIVRLMLCAYNQQS